MSPKDDPSAEQDGLETVRRAARLARLDLTAEELARLAPQFARILGAFRRLSTFSATAAPSSAPAGAAPAQAGPGGEGAPGTDGEGRADEPRPSLHPERVLAAAPRPCDGFFAVPKTVGAEGGPPEEGGAS